MNATSESAGSIRRKLSHSDSNIRLVHSNFYNSGATPGPPCGSGGRDFQHLSDLDLVGVTELVAIGVEDLHILAGIAIELLRDLRKRVPFLNRVGCGLGRFSRSLGLRGGLGRGRNRYVRRKVPKVESTSLT